MSTNPPFSDRTEAGRLLADRLALMALGEVIVFALPRGGVPVALEIARRLNAPLDLALVRKIGAPGHPELALAAVIDGEHPHLVVNQAILRATGASAAYLEGEKARELAEIERRRLLYLGDRPRPDPRGKTVIVVDDGLATGATARAAVQGLKGQGAAHVILAVPVAPAQTADDMRREVDDFVCLLEAERFWGVGGFYGDFHQLNDTEVLDQLAAAAGFGVSSNPA